MVISDGIGWCVVGVCVCVPFQNGTRMTKQDKITALGYVVTLYKSRPPNAGGIYHFDISVCKNTPCSEPISETVDLFPPPLALLLRKGWWLIPIIFQCRK